MKIFGREPAVLLAFVAGLLKLLGAFGVNLTDVQQGVLNTALAVGIGVVSAIVLKDGSLMAMLLQFSQAVMAVLVAFGLDWTAEKQAMVLSVVGLALALFERPRVQAPVAQAPIEAKSPVKG